jgi:tetratricopeptide (TPR) repeat protein
LKDARKAYGAGQFYLALDACREVRRLDPRNAEAYIIPGDVYRLQGRIDEAISSYTVAVQLDPKNVDVQNKLDRLFRQSKYSVPDADEIKNRNASLRLGLNMIVLAIIGGLFLWLNVEPGEPSVWLRDHVEFVSAWNMKFIWIMALASVLVGVLLSVNNAVRDLDDELIFPSVRASGIKKVSYPLGLILLVLSFFSFYAAGLVYVLIGWLQESVSISILRVFASVLGLVALGAMAFGQGAGQVLLFGGNLAFVGILVGWGIGDLFRPAW